MTKLLEIERCGQCIYYIVRGDLFHTRVVEDNYGNCVKLSFDEYIGWCNKSKRVIGHKDDDDVNIPEWCELKDLEV
jgi:hypothetical protein